MSACHDFAHVAIIRTLNDIELDIRDDRIQLKTEMEDIHMNIESELIKRIGEC